MSGRDASLTPTGVVVAVLCPFLKPLPSESPSFFAHRVHRAIKRHDLLSHALDQYLLDALMALPDVKNATLGVHEAHHRLSCKILLVELGVQITRHTTMGIDLAREGSPAGG